MTRRSWDVRVLTPGGSGRRNRRTVDGVALAVGAVITGLAAVIGSSAREQDEEVGRAIVTVLGWAEALWRVALIVALGLAFTVGAAAVARRRRLLVRDLLVALLLLGGAGIVLGGAVDSDWMPIEAHLLSEWGFPELRIAATTAVLVVAG